MTEGEYWDSDPEFEDNGFGDTFLSSEADDNVNVIIIPKFEYDVEDLLMGYVKVLKKCKTIEDAMSVMYELYSQVKLITIIESEQDELQNRVYALEALMEQVVIR